MKMITLGSSIKHEQSSEWDIGNFKPTVLSGFTEPKPRPAAKFRRARTLYERRIMRLSDYERKGFLEVKDWCSAVEGRAETLSLQLGLDGQYVERKLKKVEAFTRSEIFSIRTAIALLDGGKPLPKAKRKKVAVHIQTEFGEEKFCRSCEEYYPATREFFYGTSKTRRDGTVLLDSRCKACYMSHVKARQARLVVDSHRQGGAI